MLRAIVFAALVAVAVADDNESAHVYNYKNADPGGGDYGACFNMISLECCDKVTMYGMQSSSWFNLPTGQTKAIGGFSSLQDTPCGEAEKTLVLTSEQTDKDINYGGYALYGGSAFTTCGAAAQCVAQRDGTGGPMPTITRVKKQGAVGRDGVMLVLDDSVPNVIRGQAVVPDAGTRQSIIDDYNSGMSGVELASKYPQYATEDGNHASILASNTSK